MIYGIWNAFDRGSRVMPQLAAVAFLSDPGFDANAMRRIEARCPVASFSGLSSLENHVMKGSTDDRQRSVKGVNTFLALCDRKLANHRFERANRLESVP